MLIEDILYKIFAKKKFILNNNANTDTDYYFNILVNGDKSKFF